MGICALHVFLQLVKRFVKQKNPKPNKKKRSIHFPVLYCCLDIQHCSIAVVLPTVYLYVYSCNISVISPVVRVPLLCYCGLCLHVYLQHCGGSADCVFVRVPLQHCCGIADCVCTCTTAALLRYCGLCLYVYHCSIAVMLLMVWL